MKTVNILGADYRIEIHKMDEDDNLGKQNADGYCDACARRIVVADFEEKKHFSWENEEDKDRYAKRVLRHEIIHSFFNESGLSGNSLVFESAWPKNEEMIDWLAIQLPKIQTVFKELGVD